MKKIEILKYGFKIHPGNCLYLILYAAFFIAGLKNKSIISGLAAAGVCNIILLIFHLFTAYSVGKANIDHMGTGLK